MTIRNATMEDFALAFTYIEQLWTSTTYDREVIRKVYEAVVRNDNDFAFFVFDDDKPMGFCHGTFFNTFWQSGKTCYVSSLITNKDARGKGYGRKLMDHAKTLALSRGCKAIILDSGFPRAEAHRFYEKYGFKKCAYCFELKL